MAPGICMRPLSDTGTAMLCTPQPPFVGKNSSPHLMPLGRLGLARTESMAIVTCAHFVAPPEAGGQFIEPDSSSTMRMSGGRLGCGMTVCTSQTGASGGPGSMPAEPPVPPEPAEPADPPAPPE